MRADKQKIVRLLKTASGQLEGILRMVEEDQYCLDISNQVMAAESILRRVNREILKAHMCGCVKEAETEQEREQKIDEVLLLIEKLM